MSESGLKDLAKEHKLEQDHKREMDQKHKWALGEGLSSRGQPGKRPAKPSSTNYTKTVRREVEFQQNKAMHNAKVTRKRDPVFDTDNSASDTSAEDDVTEASAAREPDAGYTYSYDAARGPGKGSQILGLALAKAIENFETKATEKLVKEEYEVVSPEREEPLMGYAADEDDFELL